MNIRPLNPGDIERLGDIDAVVESLHYLHVGREGEGFAVKWSLEERPLRERIVEANPLGDEAAFSIRQITSGVIDGIALGIEHDGVLVASMAAAGGEEGTLQLIDVRVDFEHRRQGLGSALVYSAIHHARENKLRAVMAITPTNNHPAARFLQKSGFDLSGLDSRRRSNHDLVKEAVSLFWYVALD